MAAAPVPSRWAVTARLRAAAEPRGLLPRPPPPWQAAQLKSVDDVVQWYARRARIARPWHTFETPDGWGEMVDAYAKAVVPHTYSHHREYVATRSDAATRRAKKQLLWG